jgi:hypothetical protein
VIIFIMIMVGTWPILIWEGKVETSGSKRTVVEISSFDGKFPFRACEGRRV